MATVTLNDEEIEALRMVLAAVSIRDRTGELGITHGMNRFVSSQHQLKKPTRQALDSAARKLGLSNGVHVEKG